jgi:hypothetical protein
MAVTAALYGQSPMQAYGSGSAGGAPNIDWLSDTIKVMLCTSTYTPDQDTHVFKSSVTNEVASGGGYTTGGATLGSKTLDYTSGTNVIKFDAADVVWSSSTITARYAVIYDDTPATDATKPLLGFVDFGADASTSNGAFTITWDATGIFKFTVSTPA